ARPEPLVLSSSSPDEAGNTPRHRVGAPGPRKLMSTFFFAEHDRRTTLTIKWSPLDADAAERATFAAAHDNMRRGWTGTLDRLAGGLGGGGRGAGWGGGGGGGRGGKVTGNRRRGGAAGARRACCVPKTRCADGRVECC